MRTREEREKTNDLIMDISGDVGRSADAGEPITVSRRHRVCLPSFTLFVEGAVTKNSVVLF